MLSSIVSDAEHYCERLVELENFVASSFRQGSGSYNVVMGTILMLPFYGCKPGKDQIGYDILGFK